MVGAGDGPAGWRSVVASGEFRALFAAQLLSVLGDQLARVAVSVLVYERTRSAGWTAVTYGLTYVPDLVSGPLLSGLADRYPRRAVMVATDLGRAGLVAAMAVPGLPLWCAAVLLVLVQALGAPHGAARGATLAAAMTGDRYVVAAAAQDVMVQTSQVVGFATGGAVVALAGTGQGLLLDAGSFLLSAVIVRFGVRARPAPHAATPAEQGAVWSWWGSLRTGLGLVLGDRRLRALLALACVAGCYVTVEGLAVPYAGEIGEGTAAVGLLLAASPAGTVVGTVLVTRLAPHARLRLLGPLAAGACLPLVLCAWRPGLALTALLWALSGMASGYHTVARAKFVQLVPDRHRGQCLGLAVTALRTAQGGGIMLAGLAASAAPASAVIAAFGALGAVLAVTAAAAWQRASRVAGPGTGG
ncbi:MFS transporter [Saccharothrix algeriensis]|uniref:MFS transporter n=1 Tax=Saccharothrix algeriensis TaxID=173560 RepID=A0A8T8HYF7_9PSEU|nr:MFS transporter [Saccharothrix algeriensis]